MIISFLGPINSYSNLAAKMVMSQGDTLTEFPSFYDVTTAVGIKADMAVVPIENSIEGVVSDILDFLAWEGNLYITREINLEINHKLFMKEGGDFVNVKRIITHSQAYGQCRKYLSKCYKNAEIIFTSSTSKAVESLNDNYTAAIAGAHNMKVGLKISSDIICDNINNITRFVTLQTKPLKNINANKISIIFEAENKPGGLLKVLQILNDNNLNMTKIESRPYRAKYGSYIFFVDFLGNINSPDVIKALNYIKENTGFYKYLGNY